jgi:hypothetical protein
MIGANILGARDSEVPAGRGLRGRENMAVGDVGDGHGAGTGSTQRTGLAGPVATS